MAHQAPSTPLEKKDALDDLSNDLAEDQLLNNAPAPAKNTNAVQQQDNSNANALPNFETSKCPQSPQPPLPLLPTKRLGSSAP